MNDKYKTTLGHGFSEYLTFFSESTEKLFTDQNRATVWCLPYFLPAEYVQERLAELQENYPLGIPKDEIAPPTNVVRKVVQLKKSQVYKELEANPVSEQVDRYLKYHGYTKSNPDYEVFKIRVFGFIALALCMYLDDKEKPVDQFVLREKDVEDGLQAAGKIKDILQRGGQMASEEQRDRLITLLNEFEGTNTKMVLANGEIGYRSYLRSHAGSTDHALRLLVFRLVIFFKTINRKTHTSLVRGIAKLARNTVASSTLGDHIREATDYLVDMGHLKKDLYPELCSKSSLRARFADMGVERFRAWRSAAEEDYRRKVRANVIK